MNSQSQPAKIARQYAEQVVAGEILACRWVPMGSRIDTELVLNALLMALWRRQPKDTVLVHSCLLYTSDAADE